MPLGAQALRQLARQVGLRGAWSYDENALRLAMETWLALGAKEGDAQVVDNWGEVSDASDASDANDDSDDSNASDASSASDDSDDSDDSNAGPLAGGLLPLALQTETMARLLESQGKEAEARVLREGIRMRTPTPTGRPGPLSPRSNQAREKADIHVTVRPAVTPEVLLDVAEEELRLSWLLPQDRRPWEPPSSDGEIWQIELRLWRGQGGRITRKVAADTLQGSALLGRPEDLAFAVAALGRRSPDGSFRPLCRTPLWAAEGLEAAQGRTGREGSRQDAPKTSFSDTFP